MTSSELGVTTAAPLAPKVTSRHKKSKFLEQKELSYMSWNAGSLTTAVWEEFALHPPHSAIPRCEASCHSGNSLARQLAVLKRWLECS